MRTRISTGKKNLVIGIYYHPEAFPPTLNAINELSKYFDNITVIHRPHLEGTWQYPANVDAIPSGNFMSSSAQQGSSVVKKLLFFIRFVADLFKKIRRRNPSVILLYDVHALFAYWLVRPFVSRNHTVWYHNHDVWEIGGDRKFSLDWLASKVEKRFFRKLNIFTLPSADRLPFFPIHSFRGHKFVIPNYPSLNFYRDFYRPKKLENNVRLIFQGRIGEGHGLEEIIPLLAEQIDGKQLTLVLKGSCDETYKSRLFELASTHKVKDRIIFEGFTPYTEVPKISASCHIGIGIFSKKEVMHLTLGTASNKLYEYAAVGLPVIYLNQEHFTSYLNGYSWAFPVELNSISIKQKIALIISNYEYYSSNAHQSFLEQLNFERYFKDVADYLQQTA